MTNMINLLSELKESHQVTLLTNGEMWEVKLFPLNGFTNDTNCDFRTTGADIETVVVAAKDWKQASVAPPDRPWLTPEMEARLVEYYNWWKDKEVSARERNGGGYTFQECGRAQQAIEITLDTLDIEIEGINARPKKFK